MVAISYETRSNQHSCTVIFLLIPFSCSYFSTHVPHTICALMNGIGLFLSNTGFLDSWFSVVVRNIVKYFIE